MRKIINSTYITLDGAVENPHKWPSFKGAEEDSYCIQNALLQSCDAVLMGSQHLRKLRNRMAYENRR